MKRSASPDPYWSWQAYLSIGMLLSVFSFEPGQNIAVRIIVQFGVLLCGINAGIQIHKKNHPPK